MAFQDETRFDFSNFGRSAGGSSTASGAARTVSTEFDLLNPSKIRNAISGLLPGGLSSLGKSAPNIGFSGSSSPQGVPGTAAPIEEDDWRVKISLGPETFMFYKLNPGNDLQKPLMETGGLIWPYTPTITVTHLANYTPVTLTHSNYPALFYNNSEVSDINISGEFTVQSVEEGQYLLAAIYFLRSCTKMFFGQGNNAGNPPPLVFLDGYGSHYFPHVPCVITSFAHTMSGDVDYINIPITTTELSETVSAGEEGFTESFFRDTNTPQRSGGTTSFVEEAGRTTNFGSPAGQKVMSLKTLTTSTRLPTTSTLTVTVKPIYSRSNLHDRFDLEKFAAGGLLQDRAAGYGGFI